MNEQSLTKRQHEILERLEQGRTAKEIATDIGVSRNAVYLQIERLRRNGTLPVDYTPSGQPPRSPQAPSTGVEAGSGVPSPGFGGAMPGYGPMYAPDPEPQRTNSELASLRRPSSSPTPPGEYARVIEAAAVRGDVAALAYELGRLDATEREELATGMVEAALERLGALRREAPTPSPAN